MIVIQCDACAGSVVYDAAREVASCLFCGSVAVHPAELGEPIPSPDTAIPFTITRTHADAEFRRWARSSWWYPKALRELSVELSDAMLPAWHLQATVETHWAGLARGPTKCGLRPLSGVADTTRAIMVPASLGLGDRELLALQPFSTDAAAPWSVDAPAIPHEVPSITQSAAQDTARRLLAEQHRHAIASAQRLERCRGSSLVEFQDAGLLMLPIWIGCFRYRELPWRLVINAQTGRVVGRAPLDRVKVALAAIAVAVIVVAIAWWQSGPPEPPPITASSS